jgi:hypothetical protein
VVTVKDAVKVVLTTVAIVQDAEETKNSQFQI